MAGKDKPYRVYRGGREKGSVRSLREAEAAPKPRSSRRSRAGRPDPPPAPVEAAPDVGYAGPPDAPGYAGPGALPPRRRRGRRIALWAAIGLLLLALLVVGWGTAGFFSLRSGVEDANRRLPNGTRAALAPAEGSLLSSPRNILLLGTDVGPGRDGTGRADSIVLVRTDPDAHRIALLSIPRDLRVRIPGYGTDKINASYAFGGPALTIETVEELTGLPVHHVAIVDFSRFGELVDALGGVTVDVPERIVSNRFDCPYASRAECERWPGWRFAAGEQTLDGRRALVYARVRENRLDPTESDITRGGRQQQVVQAIADEVVSPMGFARLPFVGGDVTRPLATDLSTGDLMRLGWVKFRAADDATLRCRLGGAPQELDGVWYLVGSEENVAVIAMVTGEAAPQPPPPDAGPFAPGCTVGS